MPRPRLSSPVEGATVDAIPAFSWSPVRRAESYEFQLAADEHFGSIVLGYGKGSFKTRNTFATVSKTLANGTYYWRVRAVNRNDDAGRWSATRSFKMSWTSRPQLLSPALGGAISYPAVPLVLRWSVVPRAYKYLLEIGTDPSLASPILGGPGHPLETSGTVFAFPGTLAPGRYYWAVTPEDSEKHIGARSAVGYFDWSWPTTTTPGMTDLNADARLFDPEFSWPAVPGAARYEVEVGSSQDFAPGSKVCCTKKVIGTSLSPQNVLPNNHYYWRVRALDLDGNAGIWNAGPQFDKGFDDVSPSIPNLHLRDNVSELLAPGSTTSAPVVTWDPVPGASSYEVQVVPYVFGACNWTSSSADTWKQVRTATTAWTPLGAYWNGQVPGGVSYPIASHDFIREPVDGTSYCVRVLARSNRDAALQEVVSDWTQLGGDGAPAFTFNAPPAGSPPSGTLTTPAENYRLPQYGTLTTRMPYFTWVEVPAAASYFVVVARDVNFTDIVDVGFTQIPAYAPRTGSTPKTYPDETTHYYWAVMPAKSHSGNNVTSFPWQNNPQSFQKRSTPPSLLAPASGSEVNVQPRFRWTSVEGAREYRLQIAQDPTFNNPLDDVTTDATSFTSFSTYPADTVLYWRVRANDENRIGLTWSATGEFRRRLPTPALDPGNPDGGGTIPVFSWQPVQGATSYDMHVDQVDGTTRDFKLRSSSFTPAYFYGTGVWRWQIRANFPRADAGETPGPYSARKAYTRLIDAPEGAGHTKTRGGLLLHWNPSVMVKEYRVVVSASSAFGTWIESYTTQGTSYAPLLTQPGYLDGGTLYWRVAAVDEGGNVGAWSSRSFALPKRLDVRALGLLTARRRGLVTVIATGRKGSPVGRARIVVSGAGIRRRVRRTGRRGIARFKLRPRRGGTLVIRATKPGYRGGRTELPVP